jgi:hypothetical protein
MTRNKGPHNLGITKQGYPAKTTDPIDVNPSTGPIKIVLEPAVEIRGRVVSKSGKAVTGIVVVDGANGPVGPPIALGPRGSFTVSSLPPGSYLVRYGTEEREIASKRVTAPAARVAIEVP